MIEIYKSGTAAARNYGRLKLNAEGSTATTVDGDRKGNIRLTGSLIVGQYGMTGSNNVILGIASGVTGSGSANITIGSNVLDQVIGQSDGNVGIGQGNLGALGTGSNNVSIGRYNSGGLLEGSSNVSLGQNGLINLTGGSNNIAIGENSGYDLRNADANLLLGASSGRGLVSGRANTIIGGATGFSSTESNQVVLADGDGNIRLKFNGATAGQIYTPLKLKEYTNAQMNAIVSPENGMIIYNTTFNVQYYYNGTNWIQLGVGGSGTSGTSGSSGAKGATGATGATGAGVDVTNNVNNYVLTATGLSDINGESNLTFGGNKLTVDGIEIFKNTAGGNPSSILIGNGVGTNIYNPLPYGSVVAIGTNAAKGLSGGNCIAIGEDALTATTTYGIGAGGNIAIGRSTLAAFEGRGRNIAIGSETLTNLTGAFEGAETYDNIAIGNYSQWTTIKAGGNTSIGVDTLYANEEGYFNTVVGKSAMANTTGGNGNTAIGWYAGYALYGGTPSNNVFIGQNTARSATPSFTGSNNVIINPCTTGSIQLLDTGSNNVMIGANIATPNVSNNIILADGSGTIRMQFTNTGALSLTGPAVSASTTNTVTNKIALMVNGTQYYLLASTSGT